MKQYVRRAIIVKRALCIFIGSGRASRLVFGGISGLSCESDGRGGHGVSTTESFVELAGSLVIAAIFADKVVQLRILLFGWRRKIAIKVLSRGH